jgi:hypothetical protein
MTLSLNDLFSIVFLTDYFYKNLSLRSKKRIPPIGKRFAGSLLKLALEENIIDRPPNWRIYVTDLEKNTKRNSYEEYLEWRKNRNLDRADHFSMSRFLTYYYEDHFSKIEKNEKGKMIWNRHGSRLTPTHQIVVLTTNQKQLFPGEEKIFRDYYYELTGEKNIKLRFISKTKNSFQTKKGGKELINQIYHTYSFHQQSHLCIVRKENLVRIWVSDKIISVIKMAMQIEKKKVDFVYPTKIVSRDNLSRELIINIVQTFLSSVREDYHLKQEIYTEEGILSLFGEHFQDYLDQFKKLIHENRLSESLSKFILSLYDSLEMEYLPSFSERRREIIPTNLTSIPSFLFKEWVSSPHKPSACFTNGWIRKYGSPYMEEQFVEECSNLHLLDNFPHLQGRVISIPQRSKDWVTLYRSNLYRNGSSGNGQLPPITENDSPEKILQKRFNLIRGNIGESLVLNELRTGKIIEDIFGKKGELISVGMISQGGPKTKIFCPDGLIYFEENGELVPVEVKTVLSVPRINQVFLRDYNLSRLQLLGITEVFNTGCPIKKKIKRGIALYLFIYPKTIDGSSWRYDLRWTIFK